MSKLSDAIIDGWQELGTCDDKEAMTRARVTAHWAAQVAASVGFSLLRPLPDHSHTNMEWLNDRRMFAGQPLDDASRVRGAVHVGELRLALIDKNGSVFDEYDLDGNTLGDAIKWMEGMVGQARGKKSVDLKLPEHKMPDFPDEKKTFRYGDESAHKEIARWFNNANRVFSVVFRNEDDANPVRGWPHHFDIACLISIDDYDGGGVRSIGVGMSPGDEHFDEPYWYVTPWPAPKDPELPPIGEGTWQREGFFGAVLPMSKLAPGGDAQLQQVTNFLDLGIAAAKKMLKA
jgi:hypothetical protein